MAASRALNVDLFPYHRPDASHMLPKSKFWETQVALVPTNCLLLLVPAEGFEPPTP